MRKTGIKPVSCNTYISCIDAFLRWLHKEELQPELLKIAKLKAEKKVLKTFSEQQLQSIIRFKPKTLSEKRIHTLLCTLFDTGIRIDEAVNLKASSIDFHLRMVLKSLTLEQIQFLIGPDIGRHRTALVVEVKAAGANETATPILKIKNLIGESTFSWTPVLSRCFLPKLYTEHG